MMCCITIVLYKVDPKHQITENRQGEMPNTKEIEKHTVYISLLKDAQRMNGAMVDLRVVGLGYRTHFSGRCVRCTSLLAERQNLKAFPLKEFCLVYVWC